MHEKTAITESGRLLDDDEQIWFRSIGRRNPGRHPKFDDDTDIDLWLTHNAPQTFEQLADLRYVLYHRCSRSGFIVSAHNGEQFTLTGRNGGLQIVSDKARHYLLWKLRLLGRKNKWIGALPKSKRPRVTH